VAISGFRIRKELILKTISILGSGWLGLPLAEFLASEGDSVNASTRDTARYPEIQAARAMPFRIDIDDLSGDFGTFLNCNILIINITSKNVEGFTRLVSEIETSPIEGVIFVSSTSVYQNTNDVVNEGEDAENPESPLLKIENLFRASSRFKTTVVRFAGLIGYSRHPGRFFGDREIPQPEAPVNLIHRDDCIGILSAIIQQGVWGEVFNACADTHPTKREFYSYARREMGRSPPVCSKVIKADYKIIGNDKVKRVLEYQFLHPDLMRLSFE